MDDHAYVDCDKKDKKDTSGTQCYAINCVNYRNKVTKSQGISFHRFVVIVWPITGFLPAHNTSVIS